MCVALIGWYGLSCSESWGDLECSSQCDLDILAVQHEWPHCLSLTATRSGNFLESCDNLCTHATAIQLGVSTILQERLDAGKADVANRASSILISEVCTQACPCGRTHHPRISWCASKLAEAAEAVLAAPAPFSAFSISRTAPSCTAAWPTRFCAVFAFSGRQRVLENRFLTAKLVVHNCDGTRIRNDTIIPLIESMTGCVTVFRLTKSHRQLLCARTMQ